MGTLFERAARGEWTHRPPVWMMRQAGRYLPEYREIRAEHSFLEAIKTPAIATEISLQPYRRFEPDAVVMYSDILTVLEPMGFDYHLESGVGPVIENPVSSPDDVDRSIDPVATSIDYVGDLLSRLRDRLPDDTAVLGFAGGPFTLAAYIIEGEPTRSFMRARRFMAAEPDAFDRLLAAISSVVGDYLEFQIGKGADAIQVFDTYAGLLSPEQYRETLLPHHQTIVSDLSVPSIMFARNMGGRLELLAETGADVVGLDWTVDLASARTQLGETPVQGNLDPAALFAPPETIERRTRAMVDSAGEAGYICNLGHGVDKRTPVEGVATFFETVKSIDRDRDAAESPGY